MSLTFFSLGVGEVTLKIEFGKVESKTGAKGHTDIAVNQPHTPVAASKNAT